MQESFGLSGQRTLCSLDFLNMLQEVTVTNLQHDVTGTTARDVTRINGIGPAALRSAGLLFLLY